VGETILEADSLLPGEPTEEGNDPRWQAIIKVGEYIEAEPELVWEFICRWGGHPQEDLRDAIATCLLEHLLAWHFAGFFNRVEEQALTDPLFGDMVQRCWNFGQALEPANATRLAKLDRKLHK
jgi:hypothetical protein